MEEQRTLKLSDIEKIIKDTFDEKKDTSKPTMIIVFDSIENAQQFFNEEFKEALNNAAEIIMKNVDDDFITKNQT